MNVEQTRSAQTFTADTLRQALALVRAEFGPDALIIGQERVGARVAVHACLELPAVQLGGERSPSKADDNPAGESVSQMRVPANSLTAPLGGSASMHAVASSPDKSDDNLVVAESTAPANTELSEALLELGYGIDIQQELGRCTDVEDFRKTLLGRLNYARKPASMLRGRYRFIGVSGAGKTATIIKILADWVQSNNPADVAVISTDNERLAGTESLQLACQALNVHMRECRAQDLEKELGQLLGRSLVLIDTPALNQRFPTGTAAGVQDFWVVNAIHANANLLAQYRVVQDLRPAGLIVAQADQLVASDDLAKLLYEWRLPLLFFGTSPQLPRGLDMATPEEATRIMFGMDMRIDIELTV